MFLSLLCFAATLSQALTLCPLSKSDRRVCPNRRWMKGEVINLNTKEILDWHNKKRSDVARGEQIPQPPAANMIKLKWDKKLADQAERYVRNCVWQHSDQSCREFKGVPFGENLAQASSTRKGHDSLGYAGWFDKEVILFDPLDVQKYVFNETTAHYTQVVWAATERVGCGAVAYDKNGRYTNFIACHYSPSGNYPGQPVYQVGRPASDCPDKTRADYGNGLCIQKSVQCRRK